MNENLIKVEVGPNDFSMIPVSKLCGWKGEKKPELIEQGFSMIRNDEELSRRILLDGFNIIGEARPSYGGQRMMLWEVARKLFGKDIFNDIGQSIGDCVSWGAKHAIEYVQMFDIANSRKVETYKSIFPPYLYGTGRVQIGGGSMWGDGSIGSWQAQAVIKYGAIAEDTEGCPKYSGSVARSWGKRPGPPSQFLTEGAKHLIESIAQINSWEDALKALMNGYPITVASNVGYDMSPRNDGFNHNSTSWAHQMCLTPLTVITYAKPKTIKDIVVGDLVVGHDNQPHIVTETFVRPYKGLLINIKGYGHETLELTDNHPVYVEREVEIEEGYSEENHGSILVATKIKKQIKKFVNASEVKITDKLLVNRHGVYDNCEPVVPEWAYFSKRCGAVKPLKCNSDVAWLFGLFVADGSLKDNDAKFVITLNSNERDIANRCLKIIKKNFGIDANIVKVKDKNAIRVRAYSTIIARSFRKWFYDGESKILPSWIFNGWPIRDVIDGIHTGDGDNVKDSHRIINTSINLIYQIQSILLELGYTPMIQRYKYKKHDWKDKFTISWTENSKYATLDNNHAKYDIQAITTSEYDGDVYNFEVEGCHSYVANGTLVHNCAIGIDDGGGDKGLDGKEVEPHVCILNSWGDAHGHIKDFRTGETWPIGTLRVRKADFLKMLRAQDSFAYSSLNGFEARELPIDFFDMIPSR